MRNVLLALVYLVPTVYCIADAVLHREERPFGLPKFAWILILLLFPLIGAGAWLFLKFRTRTRPAPRRETFRSSAPDDDPDYLRWLAEREKRRRERDGA